MNYKIYRNKDTRTNSLYERLVCRYKMRIGNKQDIKIRFNNWLSNNGTNISILHKDN